MEELTLHKVLKLKAVTNELDYERAVSMYLKLRVLVKDNESYVPVREHLRGLIKRYEQDNWTDETTITDSQIKESDLAESIVLAENEFYEKRKMLIKKRLKENGLNQNDLAKILGHRKGYMSELVNGLRPFSKDDIVVINRLFKIRFEDLIPAFIRQKRALHIKKMLNSISGSKIKLTKKDLDLELV